MTGYGGLSQCESHGKVQVKGKVKVSMEVNVKDTPWSRGIGRGEDFSFNTFGKARKLTQ